MLLTGEDLANRVDAIHAIYAQVFEMKRLS
jgi:hypothetical protein